MSRGKGTQALRWKVRETERKRELSGATTERLMQKQEQNYHTLKPILDIYKFLFYLLPSVF